MFGDPEFFNMKQLDEMKMLPLEHLCAYGMLPYLKRMRGDIVGIEVGVLKGETSHVLLKECPNITKLYGIDPYLEHTDHNMTRKQDEMDDYFKVAVVNLEQFGDRFNFIKKPSADAAAEFENYSMDFILLDGDHSYEGMLADLEAYYPLLKKGGYFFVHDTYAESVRKALLDFRNKHKVRIPMNISKNFLNFWIKP